jgi:hypothetical protein
LKGPWPCAVAECAPSAVRLAHQQLEGAFGGFQLVAFILHLLDALQQLAAGVFVQPVCQAVLFQLVHDVAAAGKIAHQHPLPISHRFRSDVLVGGRILQHGAYMHTALVSERAFAHKRLVVAQRQVGDFGDEPADGSQACQLLRPDGGVAGF